MRITVFLVLATVLFMAGLGAAVTCVRALKDNDIMSNGRRSSTLVSREQDPGRFWVHVSFNGLVAAGLFAGGAALVVSAFRKPKNKS